METKQMAHEYALKLIALGGPNGILDLNQVASSAWTLADHMEAEAAKRIDTSRPDVLRDEPKKVDWNDAPEWANYLFHDSITLAPTWAENAPVETRPRSFTERRAVTGAPGRSRRAGVAYLWVSDLSGTVYERPDNA